MVCEGEGGDSSGEKKKGMKGTGSLDITRSVFLQAASKFKVSRLKAKWMPFSLKLAEVKHCSRQQVKSARVAEGKLKEIG